jgi:hypothetical protein
MRQHQVVDKLYLPYSSVVEKKGGISGCIRLYK